MLQQHYEAAAFFGVAFFVAAFLVVAALADFAGAFCLVTRPDLVFLRTVGVSVTAGAGASLVAVFLARGFALLALVFSVFFGAAAFFAVVAFVAVFFGTATFLVVAAFGLVSFFSVFGLGSFLVAVAAGFFTVSLGVFFASFTGPEDPSKVQYGMLS